MSLLEGILRCVIPVVLVQEQGASCINTYSRANLCFVTDNRRPNIM